MSTMREKVDAVMTSHLDSAFWTAAASASKDAAVAMAGDDIGAKIPGIDVSDPPECAADAVIRAVAEQAVYLLRHYAETAGGKIVAGESVSGLSVTYALMSDAKDMGISPRANGLVLTAKRKIYGNSRFCRG